MISGYAAAGGTFQCQNRTVPGRPRGRWPQEVLSALMSFCMSAILSNCHFCLPRIAYSGHAGTHGEKKRFSRVCRKPLCHSRHGFCLLLARQPGMQRASSRKAGKPEGGFAAHRAMRIPTASRLQIEKKRASCALRCAGFYPSAHRRADVFPASCGEKKCFFSQMKNHSTVFDMPISLTRVKIWVEMQKNI